jgi:hypothetical protein
MNIFALMPEENQNFLIEKDILSVYQVNATGKKEIKQETSPAEIANNGNYSAAHPQNHF